MHEGQLLDLFGDLVSGKFVITDHSYCVFKSSRHSGIAIHHKDSHCSSSTKRSGEHEPQMPCAGSTIVIQILLSCN